MKSFYHYVSAFCFAALCLLAGGSVAVWGQDVGMETNCPAVAPGALRDVRRVPKAEVQLDERGEDVYKIYANEIWRRTDLEVKRGQRIEISASGTVRWAQDGAAWTFVTADGTVPSHLNTFPYPDAGIGSLVMRIGKDIYPAGTSVVIEAEDDGFIEFMINDDVLGDNSGSFLVKVNVRQM